MTNDRAPLPPASAAAAMQQTTGLSGTARPFRNPCSSLNRRICQFEQTSCHPTAATAARQRTHIDKAKLAPARSFQRIEALSTRNSNANIVCRSRRRTGQGSSKEIALYCGNMSTKGAKSVIS